MLATPASDATRFLDDRISSYQPKGYVAPHKHAVREQVYHVLQGEGLMELDDELTWSAPTTTFSFRPASPTPSITQGLRIWRSSW